MPYTELAEKVRYWFVSKRLYRLIKMQRHDLEFERERERRGGNNLKTDAIYCTMGLAGLLPAQIFPTAFRSLTQHKQL